MTTTRAHRLAAAAMAALLVFAGSIPLVGAWANGPNNGNGYGTHDWILDQALQLLDKRGIGHGWVDRSIALGATDDPDTVEVDADPSRKIEHTYTATGRRGGAIHRITEAYASLMRKYDDHDYDGASKQLGLLAHFWGDLAQPYHTDQKAQEFDGEHHTYEHLVDDLTSAPDDAPGWSVANTGWDVSNMNNVRTAAIAMAAYSRARYEAVHDHLDTNDTSLSAAAKDATEQLLQRASGDLADLISSVPKGIGVAPAVGSLKLWARWHGTKGDEKNQLIYGEVRDVNGKLMEGVQVDVTFPKPGGGTETWPFWTDASGTGHVRILVGSPSLMSKRDVSGRVKTDQTSVTDGDWYYRTKKLKDGSKGFWTNVSDRSVHAGQKVTIKSYVRNTDGKPIAGLLVDWTWEIGGTTMHTTDYTNSKGIAVTSYVIPSGFTRAQVDVVAHTTAYSLNRKSRTWFERTD